MISRAGTLAFLLVLATSAPVRSQQTELVLTEGTNFAAARSSADGSFILDLQGTLWSLPAEGGQAQALTDGLGDDRAPHVSADGRRVVFQSFRAGTWDIWAMNADGSDAAALTDSHFDDREPVFSPDGSRVAFASDRSGNYDIWVLVLETGELERVSVDDANDYMPAWSPSGDLIVFVSERDPADTALYSVSYPVVDAPVQLAAFPHRIASPSVSPDGNRVALRVLEMGSTSADAMGPAPVASRLAVFDVNAGTRRDVETPPDVFPFRPVWADGQIFFTAAGGLWRLPLAAAGDATGSEDDPTASVGPIRIPFEARVTLDRPSYERRAVTFPEDGDVLPVRGVVHPVTSPDGASIVFSALGDLWVVPAEGGVPTALTRDEYLDADPSWSPDSRSVVFSSDRAGTMDLWMKDARSDARGPAQRLTTSIGAELAPAWSPDGSSLAYVDERSRLHVLKLDGSEPRALTPARRGVSQPSWSSDNVHVALSIHEALSTRFREGYNRITIVDTTSGAERVLDEPVGSIAGRDGEGPVWSPDGRTLAFGMDGGLWTLPVSVSGDPTGQARPVYGETVDFPSWLGDSRGLLFLTPRGLRRLDLSTGESESVPIRHDYEVESATGRLLIRNVRVLDGTGAPARDGRDVMLQGRRIESISETTDMAPDDIRVIDGTGKTLIPGLIEMHTHLSLPAFGSRHGKVWLSYGVTSMRTPADAPFRVLEERESIRAGRRVGPRVYFTGGTLDGDRIYYSGGLAVGNMEELEQEAQRALDLEYDLIKTYVRFPDELQKLVIEEAHRQGVFVTSHEIYPAIRYGIDGVEHVAGTSRRGYSPKLTDLRESYGDVVDLIGGSGVNFTPTVLIYGGFSLALAREPALLHESRLSILFPAWVTRQFQSVVPSEDVAGSEAVMAPIFSTVQRIAERGGRILAGTDSPIVPYGLSLILEIEQLSEAGLGPSLALRSATQFAAEALNVADELGTVEAGKIADLVLLGGDPIDDIKNLRKTEVIIVDGRLLTVEQLLRSR